MCHTLKTYDRISHDKEESAFTVKLQDAWTDSNSKNTGCRIGNPPPPPPNTLICLTIQSRKGDSVHVAGLK